VDGVRHYENLRSSWSELVAIVTRLTTNS